MLPTSGLHQQQRCGFWHSTHQGLRSSWPTLFSYRHCRRKLMPPLWPISQGPSSRQTSFEGPASAITDRSVYCSRPVGRSEFHSHRRCHNWSKTTQLLRSRQRKWLQRDNPTVGQPSKCLLKNWCPIRPATPPSTVTLPPKVFQNVDSLCKLIKKKMGTVFPLYIN